MKRLIGPSARLVLLASFFAPVILGRVPSCVIRVFNRIRKPVHKWKVSLANRINMRADGKSRK
jgi:hypothetical protein